MHLNSELLFKKYVIPKLTPNLKILEIGPAGYPSAYRKLFTDDVEWHTIDFSNTTYISEGVANLTYVLDSPYDFPIENDSYDIIISGQVIEHVGMIWKWLNELKRIIRTNGLIITINPTSWPYHEAPIDCWRIFPEGIKALSEEVDLHIELCVNESLEESIILEKDSKSKFVPGKSFNYTKSARLLDKTILFNKIIRKIPLLRFLEQPIEVAYDTISILKK